MRNGTTTYRFGPFEIDSDHRRLTRDGILVPLPDRHVDILLVLLARAGHILSKDDLIEAAWGGAIVIYNNVEVAIHHLRQKIGDQPDGSPYIETRVRQGYQFVAPVERVDRPPSTVSIEAMLAPFGAYIDGHAAVETLRLDALGPAHQAFSEVLRAVPDYVPGHLGVAYACALQFEATRDDAEPDRAALEKARHHAEHACLLDPESAEAWSTMAFAAHRAGDVRTARAAARKAVTLDPANWHHSLRHAYVSWGEERLDAARLLLSLCPGLAFPRWFMATVFIARGAFDAALEQLRPGCAAQDAQHVGTGGYHAIGLHLLHGHVLAALGRCDEALEELARERASADPLHVYARECAANTAYAVGAISYRQHRRDEAEAAFRDALAHLPTHALAAVGLAAVSPSSNRDVRDLAQRNPGTVDAAMAAAAALSICGQHHGGAQLFRDALVTAPPGQAGWLLPADPLIDALAHRDAWAEPLALLRDRAL